MFSKTKHLASSLLAWCLFLPILFYSSTQAQDQTLPSQTLPLDNLSGFRPVADNWRVVSDVYFDLNQEKIAKPASGKGVLVNDPTEKSRDHLLTTWEHGDLELDLDFMMAKGSNAGVYLQGRYEIQMFDSWAVKKPKTTDCGAIYQRWDENRPEGQKGYEGHAPAQNVSKAPGLWQHYHIVFRAPRFNAKGEKIENARFVKVVQNGVTIHENMEVTGPTRAAAFNDEKPLGPLMIQGDHGPVAIRNIRYKTYGTELATLSNLRLTAYEGKFGSVADLASSSPKKELALDVIEHQAPGSRDNFGGKITGTIHLPKSGAYLFSLDLKWIPSGTNLSAPNGAGELLVAGKKVLSVEKNGSLASATVNLEAGDYPLVLSYYKNFGYWYARSNDITLAIEGPGVPYTVLNPVIKASNPEGAITVLADHAPTMLRSFMMHQGHKLTHVISVGEPEGVNYTVDLSKGGLAQIWRGDFLETTPMWDGRGESQLALPLGSITELSGKPSLAFLSDKNAAWPDSNATYSYLGYDIKAGRPVFKYSLGNVSVRESFEPANEGKKLTHALSFTTTGESKEIWCRIAAGSDISKLPNGLYSVDNKQYFIELPAGVEPILRSAASDTKELVVPIKAKNNAGTLSYSIVW